MDVPHGDRSECDPTHRQVLAPGTPSTARVTPRSRTASRAAWAGDRGVCSPPPADGGGLAGTSASPLRSGSRSERGAAVTVYVSRNAKMGEPPRGRVAAASAVRPGSVDPPLLTYAWRIVFERQTRDRDPR
ncbi:hypothetical protein GCM10022225_78140 [Plantactinospora mayteni]|uniref:Uncharacterized protein n=2 Tax=Plantactinospora mayteni TaxID=566021 RepID=A0ABQ4ERJ4_9ACTN|nr:hypothetical protein Pma05_38290 [Plantactinospora mayteni]